MDNFDKIWNHWISSSLKWKLSLPVLQAGLVIAWEITQNLIWETPRESTLKSTSESYLRESNFHLEISPDAQELLRNFKHGIILASHQNGNFSDFPALLSLMNDEAFDRLTVGAGKSVARMYQLLFPNIKVYCVEPYKTILSEVSIRDVVKNAKEISKRVDKWWVALLPYNPEVWEIQWIHRQVMKWVEDDTPILEVTTEFPEDISYVNWFNFWPNSVYGRILWNPPPMTVKVSAELKNTSQLWNR